MSDVKKIAINLWDADAIVLFDWLKSAKLEGVTELPVTKAQKQALTDLLTQLEQTEITGVAQEEIDAAAHEVSKDMGWS